MPKCKAKPNDGTFKCYIVDFEDSDVIDNIRNLCQRHNISIYVEKNPQYPKLSLLMAQMINSSYRPVAKSGDYVVETEDNDILFLDEKAFNAKYEKLEEVDGFVNLMLVTHFDDYYNSLKEATGDSPIKLFLTDKRRRDEVHYWAIQFSFDSATIKFINETLHIKIDTAYFIDPYENHNPDRRALKQEGSDKIYYANRNDYIVYTVNSMAKRRMIHGIFDHDTFKREWLPLTKEKITY